MKRALRRLSENAAQAFETLRERSARSFLATLGVFIGVVIIIGVASALNGFRQRVVDMFEQFGSHTIYVLRYPPLEYAGATAETRRRKELTLDDAWAIRDGCPAVASVAPTKNVNPERTHARYRDVEIVGPPVRGSYPEAQDTLTIELREGRFFSHGELRRRAPVCVIGSEVAKTFFPNRSAVDKTVQVNGRRLRVLGVMEKFRDAPFGGENPEDSQFMLPYTVFREMFPWHRGVAISARARVGQRAEAIAQIEETLRLRRRVKWSEPNDFEIATSQSIVAAFDKIVFATLAVMFALSTVAFMVGGVGVMNVMLASVKERTREIGVRRALGARRGDIVWQFLIEAAAMTGVGGALGVAVGEALAQGVAAMWPALPCVTPMWARLFGFFGSVSVGLVFGLWPAIAAARLDPIEALRYE